ncbi:T9SS type A sorting domain-containing protein [Chryseobacterium ginsenosidimutans]
MFQAETLLQTDLSSSRKINHSLPSGIYFITISSKTKSTTQKIVFK